MSMPFGPFQSPRIVPLSPSRIVDAGRYAVCRVGPGDGPIAAASQLQRQRVIVSTTPDLQTTTTFLSPGLAQTESIGR
jgi:hypothetical protein